MRQRAFKITKGNNSINKVKTQNIPKEEAHYDLKLKLTKEMNIEDAKWAKIEKFERFESEMIKSLKVLYISQSNLNLSWIVRAKPEDF
jgi:hypothetical protein